MIINKKDFQKKLKAWCQAHGVTLKFVAGWDNMSLEAQGSWDPSYLIAHDTGTGVPASRLRNTHSLDWCVNGAKDARGVKIRMCNSYTARNGDLYILAAYKTWHAGVGGPLNGITSMNSHSWGHEAESQGGVWDITPQMVHSQAVLFAFLLDYLDIPLSHVINHKDWAPGRKVDTVKSKEYWQQAIKELSVELSKKQIKQLADAIADKILDQESVNILDPNDPKKKARKKVSIRNAIRLTADRVTKLLWRK